VKDYKNKLRIGVLLELGIANSDFLDNDTELDLAIIQVAATCLNKSRKHVFFLAYCCTESWESISEILFEKLLQEVQVETVKDYGIKAESQIIESSKNHPEIKNWKEKYLKSNASSSIKP